jgi:hypothetical protein
MEVSTPNKPNKQKCTLSVLDSVSGNRPDYIKVVRVTGGAPPGLFPKEVVADVLFA